MDPEEFRSAAHELVDWIADFRTGLADLPVQTSVRPGEVRDALASVPPDKPEPLAALLSDLDDIVVPGLTHVQHPRYFGWFPANASLASVLGDFASSGIGALGITWQSAPGATYHVLGNTDASVSLNLWTDVAGSITATGTTTVAAVSERGASIRTAR